MLIDFSQGENTVREKFMLIDQGFYSRLVEPLLHKFTSRIVAVDGQAVKASRRSGERASEHILTFYDTENRVVLGQKLIGNKENEISHASSMVEDSIGQDALLRPMRSIRRRSLLQL